MTFAQVSDAVWLGLIVFMGGVATTTGSIVGARMVANAQQRAKEADWQREDEVATRLAEENERKKKADEVIIAIGHAQADKLTKVVDGNAKIQKLVDGNYTASLKGTLNALYATEMTMKRLDLTNVEDLKKLAGVQAEIAALERLIADREQQQRITDAEPHT